MAAGNAEHNKQNQKGLNVNASVFQPGTSFYQQTTDSSQLPHLPPPQAYGHPGYWVPSQNYVAQPAHCHGYPYQYNTTVGSVPFETRSGGSAIGAHGQGLSTTRFATDQTHQVHGAQTFAPASANPLEASRPALDPSTTTVLVGGTPSHGPHDNSGYGQSALDAAVSCSTNSELPRVGQGVAKHCDTTPDLKGAETPNKPLASVCVLEQAVSEGEKGANKLIVASEHENDGSDWDADEPENDDSEKDHRLSKQSSQPTARSDATETEESKTELEQPQSKKAVAVTSFKIPDPRPHLNVVFIGHVDAGKSTTCGNILVLTGEVDSRTLEKYEREAKEKNRETWYYAFIVDINEEERQKGKTVEVGRATFNLDRTRFTILDAPGHKGFVPNMISGAAQADVAVLIISARKGEFETGFEKGGQTREHAMLAKTLGVSQLIVAVNKMDDPTCCWSEERYREIEKKLTPFLRSCGYNPAKDITFIPISGLSGENLKVHVTDPKWPSSKLASWYDKSQPTLFDILDNLTVPERNPDGPLRIPLLEGFRDQGVSLVGKIESGTVTSGQWAMLMPKKAKVKVVVVNIGDEDVAYGKPGENVLLRITGVEEDQITKGSVLCSVDHLCPVVLRFKAQVMVVELLEHRPLLTSGYCCVFHAHTAAEESQIVKLCETVDKTTKKKKLNPLFVKGNSMVVCEIQLAHPVCLESFADFPQLGRFTLRDEGKTIVIGKVVEILS